VAWPGRKGPQPGLEHDSEKPSSERGVRRPSKTGVARRGPEPDVDGLKLNAELCQELPAAVRAC